MCDATKIKLSPSQLRNSSLQNRKRFGKESLVFFLVQEMRVLRFKGSTPPLTPSFHRRGWTHIMITSPKYHQKRLNLQEGTKSLLLRNEAHEELYSCEHVRIFGPYVKKVFKTRFPRKKRWRSRQVAGQLYWPNTENSNCFEHLRFIECWLMILSDETFDHKSRVNLTSELFKSADSLIIF